MFLNFNYDKDEYKGSAVDQEFINVPTCENLFKSFKTHIFSFLYHKISSNKCNSSFIKTRCADRIQTRRSTATARVGNCPISKWFHIELNFISLQCFSASAKQHNWITTVKSMRKITKHVDHPYSNYVQFLWRRVLAPAHLITSKRKIQ